MFNAPEQDGAHVPAVYQTHSPGTSLISAVDLMASALRPPRQRRHRNLQYPLSVARARSLRGSPLAAGHAEIHRGAGGPLDAR
ncbi:hypothetical protein NDU88_003866 [Pleurodeles waltl]|uniref:Uncharacterized protein n=1 Tax=Pleurodeles waltl TaxID=8319 RepID=A0AAV7W6T3_PLEWA|nr:hypothetical protein NDU88_003866 [Pleurodeles waltl]